MRFVGFFKEDREQEKHTQGEMGTSAPTYGPQRSACSGSEDYTCFQCYVHSYLSTFIFRHTVMSQSKPMHTGVGFMQMSPQLQKVMLVGCDWWILIRLVCLACQKMDVDRSHYECNTESGCKMTLRMQEMWTYTTWFFKISRGRIPRGPPRRSRLWHLHPPM